jgi:galactonate dehydratase
MAAITGIDTHVTETARKPLLFVEVHDDDGRTGLGEAAPNADARTVRAAIDAVADRVVGTAVHATERRFRRLFNTSVLTPDDVPAGPTDVAHTTAASAIDVACWDLKARDAGVPLYELLGGPVRDELPTYANGWWQDVYREDDGDPGRLAAAATGVVDDGYEALKCNPFGWGPGWIDRTDVHEAVERVAAVRDAVGPSIDLLIEGHGQLTPTVARDVAGRFESFDPALFEEPTPPKASELAQVAAATTVPIATGESLLTHHAFADLLDTGIGVVQPDPLRTGGVTETMKVASMADAAGMSLAPHNACGPVGTAVSAHIAAAVPNLAFLEVFDEYVHPDWLLHAFDGAPLVSGGDVELPDEPGLGLTLDPTLL